MTHNIAVVGTGQIGRALVSMLRSGGYEVTILSNDPAALALLVAQTGCVGHCWNASAASVNMTQADVDMIKDCSAIINAGPHFITKKVVMLATLAGVPYFDLTEDVADAEFVKHCSDQNPLLFYAPQCGLAPGVVSIIANHLAKNMMMVEALELRVGALPQNPTNSLRYNLTWSVDGLINEYLNEGWAVHNGAVVKTRPLADVETMLINGTEYEAFNTSGGLGTLAETFPVARTVNYKTLRYPGHRDMMQLLLFDLELDRETLKRAFERKIPSTDQDVVVISIAARGFDEASGKYVERRYVNQIKSTEEYTAIQLTTAGAVLAVVEIYLAEQLPRSGFFKQEDIDFQAFLGTSFGKVYQP